MIATTRGALLRGSTKDALGDEIDGVTVVTGFADFPVSIIEKTRREFDEASNAWRSVRYYFARVSTLVPVEAGDRIRDNTNAEIFAVGEVERMARGLSGRGSVTLTMKRTAP